MIDNIVGKLYPPRNIISRHLTGFHVIEVFQVPFSTYLAKKKQKLCLSIGQGIAFKMITVVVVLNSKPHAKFVLIGFR